MMFDLSLDSLDNSILMAEQIMKKKAEKKKAGERKKKPDGGERKKTVSSKSSVTTSRTSKDSSSHKRTSRTSDKKKAATKDPKTDLTKKDPKKKKVAASSISIPHEEASVVSGISDASGRTSPTASAITTATLSSQAPVFSQSMIVDKSWERLKTLDGYEERLGEQIVLSMMEADPSARKDLSISSMRSMRFDEVCHTLVVIVDLIVSMVGPDIDEFEDELVKVGKQCASEGIKVLLLGKAVSKAVKTVLQEENATFEDEDSEAWKVVIDFVAEKMTPA